MKVWNFFDTGNTENTYARYWWTLDSETEHQGTSQFQIGEVLAESVGTQSGFSFLSNEK